MWITSATATTKASPDEVFARYRDVGSWSLWDEAIEDATIHGPFEAGTTGVICPVGGPRAAFTITAADPGRRFTDVTRLPGAQMTFDHTLEDGSDGETVITHTVTITGPTTFLISRAIGRKIAKGLPEAIESLARAAQAGS